MIHFEMHSILKKIAYSRIVTKPGTVTAVSIVSALTICGAGITADAPDKELKFTDQRYI